jgi:eukaryotic-like serine/threonine-protein kinase
MRRLRGCTRALGGALLSCSSILVIAPGSRLGPYEIQSSLGAGGMGEVYRAHDPRLGRDIAVKILPADVAQDADRLKRFTREARTVSALNHPNIVTVYEVGQDGDIAYMAMELVQGETVRTLLANGELPVKKLLSIGAQTAEGLAKAHASGVVHRDLKPENLMVTVDGYVKILDFGLAKQTAREGITGDTRTLSVGTAAGAVMGTVGYMPPEQASGREVDFRSDQFSLGAVLYEMATGRKAFQGDSSIAILAAILRDEPEPISRLNPKMPAPLTWVVQRCLAKDPAERYASTQDLAGLLRDLLEHAADGSSAAVWAGISAASRASAEAQIAAPLAATRQRSSRTTALVAGAALLVALAAAGWIRFHTAGRAIDSLAVLPFENASKDPDAEYLGDGLTESLISQMSRVPSLKVMARATVFRFKGTADPQEAGRKLGVGAVLTGSVSRRGNQLSISAELMEISTGARLWGEKYDRPFADLLRVQDSIAMNVTDGLRLRLSGQQKRALSGQGTENTEAYELSLKGRSLKETEEGLLEARKLYLEALEKDPKFVEAHLGVALTYAGVAVNGYAPPSQAWPRFDEEVRKALDLDPSNVRARTMLATRRFFDWDWAGTEREFQKLSNDPQVLLGEQFRPIALSFWARGKVEEAVALMERALRVDPGNVETKINLGDFLTQAGRLQEAIGHYKAAVEAEPSNPQPLFGLAEVLKRLGDARGAIDTLRKAYVLSGEEAGAKALAAARTEKDYENAEVAVARLRLGDLETLAQERYVSPLDLARLQAQVGDREKAFSSLEAAFAERSAGLVYLKVDRAWDRIRDDARFAALVRRVGIP